jgi:purine-binding chemotaxis protein CheW
MNTELLIFEVAGSKFSVPLENVEEVVPMSTVTGIPNSPPFLLGLTAVRGKVMAVIDAARRYGIGPSLSTHLMVCLVRGNMTAIAIDRPVVAGAVPVRPLAEGELAEVKKKSRVHDKFLLGGYELMEQSEAGLTATGLRFLSVDPDLFVSTEMASKVGEA